MGVELVKSQEYHKGLVSCEKEYHVGCLKDHNMADLTELPEGKWFCSVDCGRIESSLQSLLVRGVEKLPESFLDVIRKKSMQIDPDSGTDLDVSWRLLTGKILSPETRTFLSQAVAIFHVGFEMLYLLCLACIIYAQTLVFMLQESFAPIIDVVSGHDLIPAMVYGRNVGGQEYGGMYCAVLTVNSVVVSAGIFRIFGSEVAELPLVATSSGNHGKGYFQILFACIERLLAFLKVKTIVLPAAEEAGSIWTDRFGFTKMTVDQLSELKRNFWSIVRFQGTSMLHKLVPESPATES
ncbi:Increased DNA methylation 1 [Bienertia sinuspersici]